MTVAEQERTSRRRQLAAMGLSAGLLGLGVLLTVLAPHPGYEVELPAAVLALVLVPVYIAAQRYALDFEFRGESYSFTLTHLPLALGVLLVAPVLHLVLRMAAVLITSVAKRQAPVKASYNLSVVAVELGVAALVVGHLSDDRVPGPEMWAALYCALLFGDAVGLFALNGIWRVMAIPARWTQAVQPLAVAAPVALLSTGLALVSFSALRVEPLTGPVMLVLAGALGIAYRTHRQTVAQQRTTEELYELVKDLGPLDITAPHATEVLERVRTLLQARYLDLAVCDADSTWRHLVVWEGETPEDRPAHLVTMAEQVAASGTAALRGRTRTGNGDEMATPLLGRDGLLGILTASHRLADVRGFDMRDLRLLETIATELAEALERAATTDSLTGLPNLAETTRRLGELLDSSAHGAILTAVAVDSFREVNDTLGHQVGDDLLLEVTRRLQVSYGDALIGRIGGGRFAVAVPVDAHPAPAAAEMFGLGLRAQVEGGAQIGPVGTHIRLSVGVVQAPEHGLEASTLLRRAETAMYSARHAHGGPVLWEPAYEVKGQRRLAVVSALREAVASGAIGLVYQPKVDAVTSAATGVEALARWTHPALGMIRPDEFIPLAEASGLMSPLTSSVLRQALQDCKGWQSRAARVGVAVNVSADTVLDPVFVTEVAGILTSVGIGPELLTLELTEGVVVGDPKLAVERMGELRALGVRVSVDDFGTGYSSLTYLKGLPVDEVKVDKTFVDGLGEDPADRAVVRAVVDIAHTLGLKVVAEGVEQEQQMSLLRSLGVDEVQGYLQARPMTAPDVTLWLHSRQEALR